MRVVRLSLANADGKPIDVEGGAVFASTRNEGRAVGFAVKGGKCEVPAVRLPLDLRICVPGYERQELLRVDGDREVRLDAQRELVIELAGVTAKDLEGVRVVPDLKRKDSDGTDENEFEVRDATWSWRRQRGAEPGCAPYELVGGSALRRVVRMPGVGDYSVRCSLEPAGPNPLRALFGSASGGEHALTKSTPSSFTFDAAVQNQTLHIVLDADEVRQKARELAR